MTYTEPGHRLYIKKRLAKKIEAEARAMGLSMDDLILAKLNISSDDQAIALSKRTEEIESKLQRLTKLLETVVLDSGYIRGAIESQANTEATERAEQIEIRRSKLIDQIHSIN